MQLDYENDLYERKCELADLYNEEMDAWKHMILSRVETQEDRKQRYSYDIVCINSYIYDTYVQS